MLGRNTDSRTIEVYDTHVERYQQLAASLPDKASLDRFICHLRPAAKLLDLGCGTGIYASELRDKGFDVTAVDASPEMVRVARKIFNIDAQCRSFDDLDERSAYDGIWANFSLLHAPRAALGEHLLAIHTALRPAGLFHISLKLGSGEKRDALGRFYSYYSTDEIKVLLDNGGFDLVKEDQGSGTGLAGTLEKFITILARRR